MTDFFALLNEARRPWLDPEELKTRFLSLTSQVHPDRMHSRTETERREANRQYTEVNAAYQCLREPKDRLQHLLILEAGSKPSVVQQVPEGMTELFFEISQLFRRVDAFLAEKSKASSPLPKAQLFRRGLEWLEQLKAVQSRLESQQNAILEEVGRLNSAWESAPPVGSPGRGAALPLERLEELFRRLSYLKRWSGQVRERVAQVSL